MEAELSFVEPPLQIEDLIAMQHANVMNLPENYNMKYCACSSFLYLLLSCWSWLLVLILDYHVS